MPDAEHESKFRLMRETAMGIFRYALAEASIAKAFARQLRSERGALRICEDLYDLQSYSSVRVISIGKAGHTMVEALAELVGVSALEGIVASSLEPASQVRGFRYFRGGHPVPNGESIQAASATLKLLQAQTAASLVIFLLSGGGSSIVEKPIDDEIPLDDLIATYRALVHSGARIAEINAIRKHLSAVKGGRLAQAAYPAQQVSLLVSDVPDTTPDALASGPTMPDSTTAEDCYRIAQRYGLLHDAQFPPSTREPFERRALDETPKSDDHAFYHSRWWTVLSNGTVVAEAKAAAERAGFVVGVDNTCDDWDYQRAADYLLQRVRELGKESARACLISGGEVTVKVKNGGVGGRNQQFALACARNIAGDNITVLSAGTDGIDGNSRAAGAVVDGSTLPRAQSRGLDPAVALERFDVGPFFSALGDAIETGPTGNNLRDVRILLVYS
ncbi:MAG: hydroxypyruvate reductase [Acidobacteria bacterium]|nr:MAG: hydroxypyruvate reductase [Acidobacteriota bacterium]